MNEKHRGSHDNFTEGAAPGDPGSRGFVQVLWYRKWILLLGGVIGLGLGGAWYLRAKPVYQSTAKVLVIKKLAAPVTGVDSTQAYLEDYLSTHLTLIRSPLIIEKAVKKGNLASLPSFEGNPRPAAAILASLKTTRDAEGKSSSIINLTYQGPNSDDCAAVIEAIVGSYRDFLDETYRNVSDNSVELITKARDMLKKDLAVQETAYREFRDKNPLGWRQGDGKTAQQSQIGDLQSRLSALTIQKAEVESQISAIEDGQKRGLSVGELRALAGSVTTPVVGGTTAGGQASSTREESAEDRLLPLVLQEESLLRDYGAEHPKVQEVRGQISLLRKMYSRKTGKEVNAEDPIKDLLSRMRQELARIEVNRKTLSTMLDGLAGPAQEMRSREFKEESLRADLSRTQQLYEQTIRRLQEMNLVRDFGGYEARVIAPALAGTIVATPLALTLAFGSLLGLLFGGSLALAVDRTDRSFRTPDEIRRRLGHPVLGNIPQMPAGTTVKSSDAGAELVVADEVVTFHKFESREAESFRSLRTSLYFGTRGLGHPLIQITSPNMGDGKTTMVANLGTAIAQSGKRVVVVDADLRRPNLHRMFGISNDVGLVSVISGDVALCDAVQETSIEGLFLLPSGPRPANPAEALTLASLEQIFAQLREHYDFVLIDTPPLLAVTDPCIVAPRVDGVLLVVRLGRHDPSTAERASELLTSMGAKTLGVVVNGVGAESRRYGYQYSYYQYENYYYTRDEDGGKKAMPPRQPVPLPKSVNPAPEKVDQAQLPE